jgi:hypothetical protein
MKKVVRTVAVIDEDDEVGDVFPHVGAEAVGHFQAEVVIFHIGDHLGMTFRDTAELGLPVAVEDDPVDVAAIGLGFPAQGLGGVEADVVGGAFGVVGIEQGFDGALAGITRYRGRDEALVCPTPPSEPDWQISRIRLSGQRFAPLRRLAISSSRAASRLKSPCSWK